LNCSSQSRCWLPFIIRWLRVQDDGVTEKEELQARVSAVQAALVRLNDFKGKSDELVLGRLRVEYENRTLELESGGMTAGHDTHIPQTRTYELLSEEALIAERRAILQLRNEEIINDEVLRRIQRDLDLAELRLNRR
jgi:hypothetical protein